eukprot:TRINITY_DN5252_c0_g1_i1.p1 TRINITY_DN5252_c0_g1~~TRINITY_DN5252_c0_g1_i1.p1  ORF type:complete len:243 (-),score=13.30 TRINITY_DN5252_c0_g1_i1:82-774(-)
MCIRDRYQRRVHGDFQKMGILLAIRILILLFMAYIAVMFVYRYPTNLIAFSFLTFLLAMFIEIAILLHGDKHQELCSHKWFYLLFQTSWTSNAAIMFTTFFMFFNPQSIKDLNLPSRLAFIEILGMHYTPVILHLIHLCNYPKLYEDPCFLWTLVWPYVYYLTANLMYFVHNPLTGKSFVEKFRMLLFGPIMMFIAQIIGTFIRNNFGIKAKVSTNQGRYAMFYAEWVSW